MSNPNNELTLKTIRQHLPNSTFKSITFKSFYFLLKDIFFVIALTVSIYFFIEQKQYLIALLLSIISGNFFFALFVIGHDCGHGSFSKSKRVNNIVGFITHHFLLTPFWAWKKSHQKHHQYSGHIEKDESIVPFNKDEAIKDLGVKPNDKASFLKIRLFNTFIFLTGINFHLYTIYNPRTKASHFLPNTVFLKSTDNKWIYLGTLTVLLWLICIIALASQFLAFILLAYVLPLFICYHLMALVTLMQHHHKKSTWYYDNHWTYILGALNTFDYHYGKLNWLIRRLHHDIASYHVMHHLFLSIPHYKLKEATQTLNKKQIINIEQQEFSYKNYLNVIWFYNFVDNEIDNKKEYELKEFEKL